MASEVDETKKLIEARDAGYTTFGAGGLMGDSEKVWDVTDESAFTASMAVKVIRVWWMTQSSWERCRNPCKLGDGTDPAKVTADPLLPKSVYDQVIAEAQLVKSSAEAKPVSDHWFFCEVNLDSSTIMVIRDPGSSNQVQLI